MAQLSRMEVKDKHIDNYFALLSILMYVGRGAMYVGHLKEFCEKFNIKVSVSTVVSRMIKDGVLSSTSHKTKKMILACQHVYDRFDIPKFTPLYRDMERSYLICEYLLSEKNSTLLQSDAKDFIETLRLTSSFTARKRYETYQVFNTMDISITTIYQASMDNIFIIGVSNYDRYRENKALLDQFLKDQVLQQAERDAKKNEIYELERRRDYESAFNGKNTIKYKDLQAAITEAYKHLSTGKFKPLENINRILNVICVDVANDLGPKRIVNKMKYIERIFFSHFDELHVTFITISDRFPEWNHHSMDSAGVVVTGDMFIVANPINPHSKKLISTRVVNQPKPKTSAERIREKERQSKHKEKNKLQYQKRKEKLARQREEDEAELNMRISDFYGDTL